MLQRADYGIVDEAALVKAGRAAYRRVFPDETEAAAAADVTGIGRALYQVAHADGWASLDAVAGLRPLGGGVVIAAQDSLLPADPDDWPDDFLAVDGPVLYSQEDVWQSH